VPRASLRLPAETGVLGRTPEFVTDVHPHRVTMNIQPGTHQQVILPGLPQLFRLFDQQDKTAPRLFSLGLEAGSLQGIGYGACDCMQGQ
jgi:hypothetical protein